MRLLAAAFVMLAVACGGSGDGLGDGSLDCDPPFWTLTVDPADGGGERTPFDAMQQFATDSYGDVELHVETARTATVVIDGDEIALITVDELADETFGLIGVQGCAGFEPPEGT